MRDRVFTGRDVAEALAVAASTLGLPEAALRYVVLEAGSPATRGLQPTPARVAVLLEEAAPPPASDPDPEPPPVAIAPPAAIRSLVRAVATAARIEVDVEIEDGDESVVVQVGGADEEFFFGRAGRGEVLQALEHLLQRSLGEALGGRPVRVRCPRLQERRDATLAADARRLAEAVRKDGVPRTTEPLNSYERRVVHLALQGEPDLTTYSVGEGASRRVTVAPASSPEDASPA